MLFRSHQEGNRITQIGDYYYIYGSHGFPASQVCLRSHSLDKNSEWEFKVVFNGEGSWEGRMIHQASLIRVRNGDWWAMSFNDRDGFGRVPFLMPVNFIDGWPMIDPYNTTGYICYNKPDNTKCEYVFQTSDEFSETSLHPQWQFNHNANKNYYSLSDNPGHLRLNTFRLTDSLYYAPNTITQRIFGPESTAAVKMNISQMKSGDVAGLSVFAWPYASVAIEKKGDDLYEIGRAHV